MANVLRDYPELETFLLQDVRLTGARIGSGSYGSVEEGKIPGASCAVKKIHDIFQDRSEIPPDEIQRAAEQFVKECRLMTTLHHPNIVQFLGICLLPRSQLPALVMERLLTSLHELLETRPNIPLAFKCSFLCDVANGISYLHSRSPPLVHRDLSARNVLLSTAMTAKIADLGMARIVPSLRVATMTKAPGASVYMPPEALEDESRYDMTIDIFSLGVVAIFTLTQRFPQKVLAQVYQDQRRRAVIRTELERREEYMQQIYSQFRESHPLVQMIKQCLGSFPNERPAIQQVVPLLEQARAEIGDDEYRVDKLGLVQTAKELSSSLLCKNQEIASKDGEIESKDQQVTTLHQEIQSKDQQILKLGQEMQTKEEEIKVKEAELVDKKHQMESMEKDNSQLVQELTEQLQSQQAQIQSQHKQMQTRQEEIRSQHQEEIQSQEEEIQSQQDEIQSLQAQVQSQLVQLQSQHTQIQSQLAQIQSQQGEIQSQRTHIQSQQGEIESQQAQIQSQQGEIQSQRTQIQSQQGEIESQRTQIQSQLAQAQSQQAQAQSQRTQKEQLRKQVSVS